MKNEQPEVFRWPTENGKSPTGREAKWNYGVYFPDTDLCVSLMGTRSTGRPQWPGIEWIDEIHTMQLAAIMTASIQNTASTVKDRLTKDHPYWTVAYSDVCAAIDRERNHRTEGEYLKGELKDARADQARMDFLATCTAGEWEQINNERLAQPAGALREIVGSGLL